MKANDPFGAGLRGQVRRVSVHPTLMGFGAAALVLLCGCIADKTTVRPQGNRRVQHGTVRLDPGPIAVVAAGHPAVCRVDKARGQVQDSSEAAGEMAGRALIPVQIGVPFFDLAAHPAAVVIAPFAAATGAVAAQRRLPPESLNACEAEVQRAITGMANQRHFQQAILERAAVLSRRGFVPFESDAAYAIQSSGAQAVLTTEVQELHLERTGRGDSSFALRMKIRSRLTRVHDGYTLYDECIEHRTDTCLFRDWARGDSLVLVAQSVYRRLAQELLGKLVVAPPESPVLAGAGLQKPASPSRQAGDLTVAQSSPVSTPVARFANAQAGPPASLEVYSSTAAHGISIRRPLAKDQAAAAAVRDLTCEMDGLHEHPNLVIALLANAVVVPFGLYKQGEAVMTGLSPEKLKEADSNLWSAVREFQPCQDLAAATVRQLTPLTSQPVMLAKGPPPGRLRSPRSRPVGATAQLASHPAAQRGADSPAALEIHVNCAALNGDDGANPALAFCLDGEARWLRAADGEVLYSCPFRYRSESHKFTEWAAQDAKLFRAELQRCYRELGAATVDRLVADKVITPNRAVSQGLVLK